MFGIGGTEWVVIAVVLLIAVGPDKLPKLIKTLVRTYRQLRQATRDLRASSGIDEIMRDEDLRDLRRPLHVPPPKPKPIITPPKPAARALTYLERRREDPAEGVDLEELRYREARPTEEERAANLAEKEAAIAEEERIRNEKMRAAGLSPDPTDPAEHDRIVAAKEAAARAESPASTEEHDREEHDRIVAAKEAAARMQAPVSSEERERIVAAKEAAARAHHEAMSPAERERIVAEKEAAARAHDQALDGEALDAEERARRIAEKEAAAAPLSDVAEAED